MPIKILSIICPTVNTPAPAAVLTTITITGCTTVQEGSTCQLTATGRDQYGANYPLTGIVWTSLNPTIATINTSGVVSGINWGHSNITARVGTITSSQLTVQVTAAPAPACGAWRCTAGEAGQNTGYKINDCGQIIYDTTACPIAVSPAVSPCNTYRISRSIPLTGQGTVTKTMAINAVVEYFSGIMGTITTQAERNACAISIVVDYFGSPTSPAPTDPTDVILYQVVHPATDGSTPIGTAVCNINQATGGVITGWDRNQGGYVVYFTRTQVTNVVVPSNLKLGAC